jgi:hypothetical protein
VGRCCLEGATRKRERRVVEGAEDKRVRATRRRLKRLQLFVSKLTLESSAFSTTTNSDYRILGRLNGLRKTLFDGGQTPATSAAPKSPVIFPPKLPSAPAVQLNTRLIRFDMRRLGGKNQSNIVRHGYYCNGQEWSA